jgi:hypothetical protein
VNGQTPADAVEALVIAELGVTHLSAYALDRTRRAFRCARPPGYPLLPGNLVADCSRPSTKL